ncbi:MAG: GGDEF domain-containing protein [Chloroflexota bacterium]
MTSSNESAELLARLTAVLHEIEDVVAALRSPRAETAELGTAELHRLQEMAGLAGEVLARLPGTGAGGHRTIVEDEVVDVGMYDSATNLPNRLLFFDRLRQALQVARREDAPLAVLLVELALSDRGGGGTDETLRECAAQVRGTLRASDTVARIEQRRFAVLLPGANSIGAVGTARKILRALGQPAVGSEATDPVPASIGIAIFPDHGQEAEALVEQASKALVEARMSPVRSAVYSPE